MPFWGELLLYASLPLFHFHTFLFLSALLGVWLVFRAPARRDLARLVIAAFRWRPCSSSSSPVA
ncbi:MAG: hypothetical protein WDN28_17370 [Chthoniobacter sp.]